MSIQEPGAFYMVSRPEKAYPDTGHTRDRYATNMSEHFVRGVSKAQPYCYVGDQWQRYPAPAYNTCRLGASERWGPQGRVGEYKSLIQKLYLVNIN